MQDNAEFKLSLIKPWLLFIGLAALVAFTAIRVNHWHFAHGRPLWAEMIMRYNYLVNMALIVGWFAYVQFRRRKSLKQS
jgi:hypothetical protein